MSWRIAVTSPVNFEEGGQRDLKMNDHRHQAYKQGGKLKIKLFFDAVILQFEALLLRNDSSSGNQIRSS